jgi:uncharacterized protein YybS (DUF2232 family)
MSIADSLPEKPETNPSSTSSPPTQLQHQHLQVESTLRMVETAFLASTASLIWFINFYFPLGPVLRIFFPIPIALVYLRWGKRAAWMAAVTSGLLLSVLMGPVRSLLFVIPFALMGVLLGATWYRRVSWIVSIVLGTLLGTVGMFFRLWFLSVLSGEDLWVYVINQVTALIEWFFLKFELLMTANLLLIQLGAIALVVLNNIIYLFLVHLTAWLLFDRLGNPIPRPPHWVQVLMDYE